MATDACCDDQATTPVPTPRDKGFYRKGSDRKKAFFYDWLNTRNPLEAEIKDGEELQKVFEEFPLIPYAGTDKFTGHSLLMFFMNIVNLSPTHGSCIERMTFLSFGGKVEVSREADDIFDFGDEVEVSTSVSRQEATEVQEVLKSIKINSNNFKEFAKDIFKNYKSTGNGYLLLTLSESMGSKAASITRYDPDEVMYIKNENVEGIKYVAISNYFTREYLKKFPPKVVPVYPHFATDSSTGTQSTLIHIKNGGKWYGRPDSIQAFMYFYREWQDAIYLIKSADNGFVGQVLIEVEGDDPEHEGGIDDTKDGDAGFEGTADRLEKNFTNKGDDPMSILFMERPYGAKAAFVKQFQPNTNENFYKVSGEISELKIIQAHKLTQRLMGEAVANGLSDSTFMDEFELLLPTIDEYQSTIEFGINTALQEIFQFYDKPGLEGIYLRFQSPYKVVKENTEDDKEGDKLEDNKIVNENTDDTGTDNGE
jgi:hypothetical protein